MERLNLKRKNEEESKDYERHVDKEMVACMISDLPKVTHVVKGGTGIPTQDRNTLSQDLSP